MLTSGSEFCGEVRNVIMFILRPATAEVVESSHVSNMVPPCGVWQRKCWCVELCCVGDAPKLLDEGGLHSV